MTKEEQVNKVLAHHGVKGMKWGSRKGSSGESSHKEVTAKTSTLNGKARIKVSGGEGHPAHPDAVAAKVVQQKLKKSGTQALSNKEIQDLVQRKNLESQLQRTVPKSPLARGAAHVSKYLQSQEGQKAISTLVTAKVGSPSS